MLDPDRLRLGFHVFVGTEELQERLTAQATYLRSNDAAREELASNSALRADPNARELAARLCEQTAELCEFLAAHLPYTEERPAIGAALERSGVVLALPMQELSALLPLLGFKLNVTVRAPTIQRPPPPGPQRFS